MKITDRPIVIFLSCVMGAFLAGIGTYTFFKSHVGDAVDSYLKLNSEKLPTGPAGPAGMSDLPIGSINAWHQDFTKFQPHFRLDG